MRPEKVAVGPAFHEHPNEVGHSDPEQVTVMLANNSPKSTPKNR